MQQQVFSNTRFDDLEIPEVVLKGIRKAGYEFCTPVQKEVLPRALKGENIAAQSQTGTGKTATFLITLLTRLVTAGEQKQHRRSNEGTARPRALILAPTRELVVQIGREAGILAEPAGIRFQAIYGGVDYEKQRRVLVDDRADVIVATPGRLIDYQKQGVISLREIEVLVIDEADRMFDMGFIPDVRWLLRRCAPAEKRQSLLFSATLSAKVMELAYEHLNISEAININPEQITVDKIEQRLYHVGKDEKLALLFGLLEKEKPERSLIFTNTKRMAERLEKYLKANGYAAACLTGDVPQKKRETTLERFKQHKLSFLIATDVASRGLHIEAVTHVFNYDLPQDPEDYVHRIGRTARIGATGTAIALAGEEDAFYIEPIEKLIGYKIPVEWAENEDFVHTFKRPLRRGSGSFEREHGSRHRNGRGSERPRGNSRRRAGSADGSGSRKRTRPARKDGGEKIAAREEKLTPHRDSEKTAAAGENDGSTAGRRRQRRRRPRRKNQATDASSQQPEPAPNGAGSAKYRKTAPAPRPKSGPQCGVTPEKAGRRGLLERLNGIFRKNP